MMLEWTKSAVVEEGGVIHVVLPDLHRGAQVEVTVRHDSAGTTNGKRPGYGNARGQVRLRDDFDAPLDDFKDYV